MSADLTAADAARAWLAFYDRELACIMSMPMPPVGLGPMSVHLPSDAVRVIRDLLAEVGRLTAEVERLRLDALDTVRVRAEHALLVRFAGQPLACGQCGAAVMRGYLCTECGADPMKRVR